MRIPLRIDLQELSLYLIVSVGSIFGYATAFVMPVLVAPLIAAFGFNEQQIGLVFSLELSGIAIAAMICSARTSTMNFRSVAISGAIVASLGHLLALIVDSVWLFGATRLLAGLGEGTVLAVTFAFAARSAVPERAFAISQLVITAIAVGLLLQIPQFIASWDYRAAYGTLLLVFIIFTPALFLLSSRKSDKQISSAELTAKTFPCKAIGALILIAYVLTNLTDMGIWAFAERTGTSIQVPAQRIAELLALAQISGIAGSIIAATVQTKYGRVIPLSAALVACFFVVLGIGSPANPTVYSISILCLPFVTMILWPYLLGALASLDQFGSWTALGGSASAIGVAIGPFIAGTLAEAYSYRIMTWILCTFLLLALLFIQMAFRKKLRDKYSEAVLVNG